MPKKPDIRGYINPFVPGGKTEAGQKANMPEGAVTYTENREGTMIVAFLRSLRPGSMAAVEELHCLAPGKGWPSKRREAMGERVKNVIGKPPKGRGATLRENYRGLNSSCDLPAMLLHGSEQIARSGQARRRDKEGRPPEWPKGGATWNDYDKVWRSRDYGNDPDRRAAIVKEFGSAPSIGTLRRVLGSPHKSKTKVRRRAVVHAGQIYKENDPQFTRYVRVQFVCVGRRRVRIQRCLSNGKIPKGSRSTEAAEARFGKAYTLVRDVPAK